MPLKNSITVLLICWLLLGAGRARAESANRVVLRVNDRIITLYDYEQAKAERVRAILARTDLETSARQQLIDESAKAVLRELFEDALLLSRADQLGVNVTSSEVAEAITKMREANEIKDDEEFERALREFGMTREQLERQFERRLALDEVMGREVSPRVAVEPEDAQRYYRENPQDFLVPEQAQVEEIVVLSGDADESETLALAQELRALIVSGKSLEEVAAAHEGNVSAPFDLGWVSPGDLDPTLDAVVFALEPGAVSEPIAARGGLHLVLVLGRRDAVVRPFDEVSTQIQNRLRRDRFDVEMKAYLAELETKAFIRGRVPPEADGFRSAPSKETAFDFPLLEPAAPPTEQPATDVPPGDDEDP
jgi:peptidyl-prolyl cis-trans isomerase SurA